MERVDIGGQPEVSSFIQWIVVSPHGGEGGAVNK